VCIKSTLRNAAHEKQAEDSIFGKGKRGSGTPENLISLCLGKSAKIDYYLKAVANMSTSVADAGEEEKEKKNS